MNARCAKCGAPAPAPAAPAPTPDPDERVKRGFRLGVEAAARWVEAQEDHGWVAYGFAPSIAQGIRTLAAPPAPTAREPSVPVAALLRLADTWADGGSWERNVHDCIEELRALVLAARHRGEG